MNNKTRNGIIASLVVAIIVAIAIAITGGSASAAPAKCNPIAGSTAFVFAGTDRTGEIQLDISDYDVYRASACNKDGVKYERVLANSVSEVQTLQYAFNNVYPRGTTAFCKVHAGKASLVTVKNQRASKAFLGRFAKYHQCSLR